MLEEIERLRGRAQHLETELQREKDEKRELQEARISAKSDPAHFTVSCDLEAYHGG